MSVFTPDSSSVATDLSPNATANSSSDENSMTAGSSQGNKNLLPPCKVCGVQATGFHYGVNTCEACKGFFRRSLIRTEVYQCAKGAKCTMQPGKRNLCPYCRHRKCLEVGMSKEGIKTGRYTYSKRTKDTLELRKLKQEKIQEMSEGEKSQREADILSTISQVVGTVERKFPRSKDPDYHKMIMKMQQDYKAKTKVSTSEKKPIVLPNPVSSRDDDPNPEYKADSSTLSKMLSVMQMGIGVYIAIIKEMPNFKLLPMPDQIEIVKSSVCSSWMISRHMAFDIENNLFTTINGFTIEINDIAPPEFSDLAMLIAQRLQKLKLSREETLVLQAMDIFSTDQCTLQNREMVEETHTKFLTALEYLFARNHPNEPRLIARVISILIDIRSLSHMFYKLNGSAIKNNSIPIPPLLMEVLDFS